MRQINIVVEKHSDGYVAYPLGLKGVVVGQGDSYDAAVSDVKSALRFHAETFGPDALDGDPPLLEASSHARSSRLRRSSRCRSSARS